MKLRRTAGGSHSFKDGGKRISASYGDVIEVKDPEVLGSHIKDYEKVSSKAKVTPGKLAGAIAREEFLLRKNSIWLDGGRAWENGRQFQPVAPTDVKGLERALDAIVHERPDSLGALPTAREQLAIEWKRWKKLCKAHITGTMKEDDPSEPHLSAIAKYQARVNVHELEVREIEKRLAVARIPDEEQENRRREQLKGKGTYSTLIDPDDAERRIFREVDARPVEYVAGEAKFADDGSDVQEYLQRCREGKAA